MKKQTLCKLFALIASLLLVCGMCLTASAEETEKGFFEVDGTTLMKYNGPGGEVTVPDGIEVLGESAFEFTNVTKVNLPETLKEIKNYCFHSCYDLTEITLPASLKTISEAQAFAYNTSLQAINVAEGNQYFTSVDGVLFDKSLTTLLFYPSGRNRGGQYAIPEGTKALGYTAFSENGLTAIEIPSTLSGLGFNPDFTSCTKLKEFKVSEKNPYYRAVDGMLFDQYGKLICYPAGREQETMTAKDFPAEMREIGSWAFQFAQNLKNVTLPDGITSIPWMCFTFSPSLESVTVPESVTYIDGYAFADNDRLEQVVILNPEAKIVAKDDRYPDRDNYNILNYSPHAVLYGHEGSTAQAYAKEYNLPFQVISPEQDPTRNQMIDAFIARCYQNILGREATADEQNTWYKDLSAGTKTAAEIADQLATGNEFKRRHLSFADMVENLFQAMLNRSAEAAEKTDLVNMLKNGQRLKSVLNAISSSDEYISLCKNCGLTPGIVKVPVIIKK